MTLQYELFLDRSKYQFSFVLFHIDSYINVRMHKPADQDQKALEKFTIYVSTSHGEEAKKILNWLTSEFRAQAHNFFLALHNTRL